jgi:hypothetical protein
LRTTRFFFLVARFFFLLVARFFLRTTRFFLRTAFFFFLFFAMVLLGVGCERMNNQPLLRPPK